MDKSSILLAKIAALKKLLDSLDYGGLMRVALGTHIEPLLPRYEVLIIEIKKALPDLYSDLPEVKLPMSIGQGANGDHLYSQDSIIPLINNLDYILEVRAHSRLGEKIEDAEKSKKIFISHGQSKEWYKVQSYLEKDLHLSTLELAQEANLGRTILQKLNEEANRCGYAVIVMTGDDVSGNQIRARENVLHEIGFLQGKYGLQNIVLLHEEGVNIPSNIHGLVYIPFPQNTVEATFGALTREIKAQIQ